VSKVVTGLTLNKLTLKYGRNHSWQFVQCTVLCSCISWGECCAWHAQDCKAADQPSLLYVIRWRVWPSSPVAEDPQSTGADLHGVQKIRSLNDISIMICLLSYKIQTIPCSLQSRTCWM